MAGAILDKEIKKFNDNCAVRVTTEGKLAPALFDKVVMVLNNTATERVETYTYSLAGTTVRTIEIQYSLTSGEFISAEII